MKRASIFAWLNKFVELIISKPVWIIQITYSKHGGKYYPKAPKSKSHAGRKISNQYMTIVMYRYDAPTFVEVRESLSETYPNHGNLRILDIKRIQ